MSEALDLRVNAAAVASVPPTAATVTSSPPPQTPSVDHLDSASAAGLLSFPCTAHFLQKCAATFTTLPHSPTMPLATPPASALLPASLPQQPSSNPAALGANSISGFMPLVMPTLPTNGQAGKETAPSAVDLSIQTTLQSPLCPVPEAFFAVDPTAPQMKAPFPPHLISRSTVNGFQSLDYLPFLDLYARGSVPFDHKDFLKKFSSFHECGNAQCRAAGLKEHLHCTDCYKVINRREETIRHVKWHRKRMESLQYGFMRYSSSDNCGYNHCSHNMKQTHYHCIRANCSKTYISTSDVQMHANYHRKDAVILQEGFRRFRAAEDCGSNECPFAREHTTHFHCRRPGCNFTFKNKADMEKHKNHHLKNDAIAKDGFRKFTKSENCSFIGCKYSGLVNHIHCIRPGCDYIVHSTSQISSHKRKHERRESISFPCSMAPQNQQSVPLSCENNNGPGTNNANITASTTATTSATTTPKPSPPQSISPTLDAQNLSLTAKLLQRASRITEMCWQKFQNPGSTPPLDREDASLVQQVLEEVAPSLKLLKGDSSCTNQQCPLHSTGIDHFHCFRTGCMDTVEVLAEDKVVGSSAHEEVATISSGDADAWREHWFMHAWQSTLRSIAFAHCSGKLCNSTETETETGAEAEAEAHLHCYLWPTCDFTIAASAVTTAARLVRHLTRHNQHFGTMVVPMKEASTALPSEVGSAAQRKRGRPPKHSRDIHIPRLDISPDKCVDDSPTVSLTMEDFLAKSDFIAGGLKFFPAEEPLCVDRCCPFYITRQSHFHCIRPRCHLATPNLAVANSHRREFHAYVTIEPGYEYFDRSVDCRRPACYAKRDTAHYHCLRPRCGYSFVRVSKMKQHTEFHEGGGSVAGPPVGGVVGVEKNEEALDPYLHRPTSILPPLGLDKGGAMDDFMPFLMRILAEQVLPRNRPEATSHAPPETAESISTESEEKMDWSETAEKEEEAVVVEAGVALPPHTVDAMDEDKVEVAEKAALTALSEDVV